MMNHAQNLRMYAEWCDLADLRRGDRYLIVNPFFHTFGYKAGCIASFIRGATMLPVPVFDIDTVVELIAAERITMLPGPPTCTTRCWPSRTRPTGHPARRGDRRGRHPGGAHPPGARGTSVPDTGHRLRAHRGRHGHDVPTG